MDTVLIHRARQWRALPAVVAAVLWLVVSLQAAVWGAVLLVPVALLLVTGATSAWLHAGDSRPHQLMAVGAVLGLLLLPFVGWSAGWSAWLLAALAVGVLLSSGWLAAVEQLRPPGVPNPPASVLLAAKVAADNALLGYFVATAQIPGPGNAHRIAREMIDADALMQSRGWTTNPAQFHRPPSLPADVSPRTREVLGRSFVHLRWTSGFEPHPELPAAARYKAHSGPRHMHAWMLRHDDGPRPWLIAIHGYRMGVPAIDLSLFSPEWLHERLGLNLLLPVLPLHGPRRIGRRSGDGYLGGEFLDLVHAQTQALHDLRASVHWLKQVQQAEQIGVLGYSLGGYNASLLATYEAELDCVIAGIPLADAADVLWRHFPVLPRRSIEALGVSEAMMRRVMHPLSPLARPAMVRSDRCAVFGALADQLVPPAQVQRLAAHWGLGSPTWYAGSHLSVRREALARYAVERALLTAGMIDREDTAPRPLIG
ncbi:MAG: prolyl oligopeptidase family serine peptidase [Abyssibacter sp.]|uniref:alpha/beta hydrolase family protein n=1 Tax=Abyssibacter sp. TaxID=2320200 RepID=UPI003219D784